MTILRKKQSIILFLLIFTFIFAGCSNNTSNPPANTTAEKTAEAQVVMKGEPFDLLQKASDDFVKKNDLAFMTAKEVYEKVIVEGNNDYFVVDVRAAADFAAGNIAGSVNIPYNSAAYEKQIANLPKDKKIVVVCYSGHTASQTAVLWRMLGYDATPMLNGMGGWTNTPGLGTPLLEKAFDYPVETNVVQKGTFDLPNLEATEATNIEELIMQQSQSYLESGKGPVIKPEDVMNSIKNGDSQFFLLDTRSSDDYKNGHVPNAINIPYKNVAELENLKKLPPNQKIVVIGYTGNDASHAVRILNQLGYDSYAMLRGMRVWTSDADVNGIAPIFTEKAANLPTKVLNVDLEGGGGGTASCG